MVQAFNMLDQDDRVKVIVVTGEGKNFCAGADLEVGLERTPGVGAKEHRDGFAYPECSCRLEGISFH